jgi:hypothetical protein
LKNERNKWLFMKKLENRWNENRIFFLFLCGSNSGCPATNFCQVSEFLEPIKPRWESNRTCQPDPRRAVKHQSLEWERGCRRSGSNACPRVRELARWTTRPHRQPKTEHQRWHSNSCTAPSYTRSYHLFSFLNSNMNRNLYLDDFKI